MITVIVYQRSDGEYIGFETSGHAGYADEGYDIICAAVSALTVNAVNSVETFTEDEFGGEQRGWVLKMYDYWSCQYYNSITIKINGSWIRDDSGKLRQRIHSFDIQGGVRTC